MNKLTIDAANDNIFLMVIGNDFNHNISYENSKINYEKLTILINKSFIKSLPYHLYVPLQILTYNQVFF